MIRGTELNEDDLESIRLLIGAYLELMLEHFARCKRACLHRSKTPREDTPADRMMLAAADSASKALGAINYMVAQLQHAKNLRSAWDRSLGQSIEEN